MKRIRLIVLPVFVLLAAVLALYLHHNREPSYQGRTLMLWLRDFGNTLWYNPDATPFRATCTNAVKHMGIDAIPFLQKKLTAKETAFDKRMKSLLKKQSLIHFHFTDPARDNYLGLLGFQILGKDGNSAASDLVMLTKDPDPATRLIALHSLYAIKPDQETFVRILTLFLYWRG